MMQSVALKFTNRLKYWQNDIVFDLKIARMCPTESVTIQCGLSAGKQNLTVIVVLWSSMQVTKGTWRMHEHSVYQAFLPPPHTHTHTQEPGNEARVQVASSPGLPTVQFLSMPNWRGRPGPLHHVNDVSAYLGRQWGEKGPPSNELEAYLIVSAPSARASNFAK